MRARDRHARTMPSPGTAHWLGLLAATTLLAAIAMHAVQLLSLGPWAAHWPRAAAWPAGFHLWVAETACLVSGLFAWVAQRSQPRWQPWLARQSGARRARLLTAALVLAQLLLALGFWLTRNHGVERLGALRALFWLGGEYRLHALFCVAQAGLAGWLAWRVYRCEGARVWAATAIICVYIGLDELLSLHESVGLALHSAAWLQFNSVKLVHLAGAVHVYAWQLVFLPLAAAVGLALLRGFWRVLDARTLALLVLAALTFLAGAIGFETVQATATAHTAGWMLSDAGHLNLLLEEALETAGMTLALWVFALRAWGPARATMGARAA